MKAIFNKIMIGAALAATVGMSSCVGDLDQLPKDPSTMQATAFKENPRLYIGELAAKCYLGLANSGQGGANGASDIKGVDGGTFQLTRCIIMLNEFPTDEMWWIYPNENGLLNMLHGTWSPSTEALYGAYSRFYSHIGVCNEFVRLSRELDKYGVKVGGEGETAISQEELDQLVREVKALRAFTYFSVIDFWGRATMAWDDQPAGEAPKQAESRNALFRKVLTDLEEVERTWPDGQTPTYGRIGKEAVQALLCRYYLNAEIFSEGTMTDGWQKCWDMAQKIIGNHENNNVLGGLAPDYLSLFCGSNDMFMPGGALTNLNEILWGVPMHQEYTTAYGSTQFLVSAPLINHTDLKLDADDKPIFDPADLDDGFCNPEWYASNDPWGCAGCRPQFNEKFNFTDGVSDDARTYLWLTSTAGYGDNLPVGKQWSFYSNWHPIKFTNLECEADGTMPKWVDAKTGLNRAGKHTLNEKGEVVLPEFQKFVNTDMPLIRLADVYLMAAECAVRGAGDKNKAMGYINYVRSRAGIQALTNVNEMTQQFVLDERARELYWEGTRRTDLIRNGLFCTGYSWAWKGGNYAGSSLDKTHELYPIPQGIKTLYGKNLEQNPGYNQ